MSILRFKTRSNTNPQGKPKVYFCAPPEDYSKYFDIITNEILSKQNCSVWYLDDVTAARSEELLIDLEQMQLFVMPVTTNLLCTANDALDVDFKFAMEHHIPVLPLMQEPGLEELFNKKCGELQFLDKNKIDETTISYEEKLEKYLSSVLIGDELAEKIRAAFDAYVFLSYRKKDRKYAQELMRLIHKNDFCRDIAIWYDEFLTPGENFNDSIKDALQKSGLFVLAVTPNLVNETNYIMTTEYPMAREEGKPILPAELVPTDREQLFEKYKDIPTPANAHDDLELSEALLESIKRMDIKENDASPEHNFFIGLAYLGGVDVEVDFNRARILIESAADMGLIDARRKLVSMYLEGIGVKRDFEKAILWQNRILESFDHQVISFEEAKKHIVEMYSLTDILLRVGGMEEALQVYNQVIELCDRYSTIEASHFIRVEIITWIAIGDILKDNGIISQATNCYEKAFNIYKNSKNSARFSANAMFLIAGRLGEVCFRENNYGKAKEYFKFAIELCKDMSEETSDFNKHLMLSIAYNNLSLVCESESDNERAIVLIEKSINEVHIATNIMGAETTYPYLLSSTIHLSNIYERMGDRDKSLRVLLDIQPLCLDIYKKTGNVDAKRELARIHKNIAFCYAKEFERANENFIICCKLYSELIEQTNSYSDRVGLLKACSALGNLFATESVNVSFALACYDKASEIINTIGIDKFLDGNLDDVIACFSGMGSVYHLAGRYQEARTSYLRAISVLDKRNLLTIKQRHGLAYDYCRVAESYFMESDYSNSILYYERAAKECMSIENYETQDNILEVLASCYDWLGIVYRINGDLEPATEYCTKAYEIIVALGNRTSNYKNRRNIVMHNIKFGELAELRADELSAKEYYKKCVKQCIELSREFSFRQCYSDLAAAYYQLSRVEDRKTNLSKAYSIISQLSEQFPDVVLYSKLKHSYKKELDEM